MARLDKLINDLILGMTGKGPLPPVTVDDASDLYRFFDKEVDAGLGGLDELVQREGRTVACKAGCNACCATLPTVWSGEAHKIARWLDRPANHAVRDAFLAAYPRWRDAIADVLPRFAAAADRGDADAGRELSDEVWRRRVMCAFNVDGACSIYAARPIICRSTYVYDTSAHCGPGTGLQAEKVHLPVLDQFERKISILQVGVHRAMGAHTTGARPLCQAVYDVLCAQDPSLTVPPAATDEPPPSTVAPAAAAAVPEAAAVVSTPASAPPAPAISPESTQRLDVVIDALMQARAGAGELPSVSAADAALLYQFLHGQLGRGLDRLQQWVVDSGQTIACKPGCSACCRSMPAVFTGEAVAIVHWMMQPEHHAVRDAFLARYPAWREQLGELVTRYADAADRGDPSACREVQVEAWSRMVMCAFNVDGLCSIYEVRPTVCRTALAANTAEHCAPGSGGTVDQPRSPQIDEFLAKKVVPLEQTLHAAIGGPTGKRPVVEVVHTVLTTLLAAEPPPR